MRNYLCGDPEWILSNEQKACAGCGHLIAIGAQALYYPRTDNTYCHECGEGEWEWFKEQARAEYAVTGPLEWEPDDADDDLYAGV